MLIMREYIGAAMRRVQHKVIEDDGSIFATIPGFDGLWANAPTLTQVNEELESALEGWILLAIAHQHPIPELEGIDFAVREVA
jgi:predicted RNase H-like HicB family nuclease